MDTNPLSKSDQHVAQLGESQLIQDQLVNDSTNAYQEQDLDPKHSGPGIASFIISIVTLVGYIITFLVVGAMATSLVNPDGTLTEDSLQVITLLGLSVLALAVLNVIGVIIGIIGLAIRRRRKVFGIIGTIINGVIILLFMLLITTFLVNAGTL